MILAIFLIKDIACIEPSQTKMKTVTAAEVVIATKNAL